MTIIIYGIKNCNTMQKAFGFLGRKNLKYLFHDYKKSGITDEKIREWFTREHWESFINKKGLTWKKLDDSWKASIINEQSAIDLMKKHPSVIKRPILEIGNKLYIGYDEHEFETIKPNE
jgi:arsenate reductase (glutaredoxin)